MLYLEVIPAGSVLSLVTVLWEGAQAPSWLVVGGCPLLRSSQFLCWHLGSREGGAAKKQCASDPQRVESPVGLLHISIIESRPKDFSCELD